jgi:hypothetical protein
MSDLLYSFRIHTNSPQYTAEIRDSFERGTMI